MDESNQQPTEAGASSLVPTRGALAAARRWMSSRWAAAACAALLAVMSLQMLAVVWRKSITTDEIVMIPSAYYYLVAGDCRLVNEHPPFVKLVAALPLLFVQPKEAPPQTSLTEDSALVKFEYADSFWGSNNDLFESLSFWPRVAMIALAVALGLLVFAFARELFGARAAVLAVALYSLEPTVLAHGRVVQTDIAASFGYLLLFFTLYRSARAPSTGRAVLVGVACGAACVTKFSMLVAAPILFVAFLAMLWRAPHLARSRKTLSAHACLVALAALFVIHAAYFFDRRPLDAGDRLWIEKTYASGSAGVLSAAAALSYVLPTDFVMGIFWQLWHNRAGHPAGLLGMYSRTGWWYYFPVAFALKTTVPFLLLSLASLAWGAHGFFRRRDWRFLLLLAPFALYTAGSMASNLDIGVRYYLPAYPFLFIMSGALLDRLLNLRARRALGVAVVAVALGWCAFEAPRAYPDHMTYMNQLPPPAPPWWYLSDSNVEWGDDVRELATYLKARGVKRVRAELLGGFFTLPRYGVGYVDALAPTAAAVPTRYTAIGASFLNGSTVPEQPSTSDAERGNTFDAYRRRRPEAVFGGSIYLFREGE